MAKIPTFISFAKEDERIRDLFIGQGNHPDTPWNIADWSLHEPFNDSWKTQTRSRIKRCKVTIQLVGHSTCQSDGALWEVNCSTEEGIPAFGVWIYKEGPRHIPPCFQANNIINWTWEGIGRMISKAAQSNP